jgi:hypothetical protein
MWISIETVQFQLVKIFLRQFNKDGIKSPAFHRMESIILKDLSKLIDAEKTQNIYSNRLYLSLGFKSNEQNLYIQFQLFWWVLKARGRLRWLCFRLLPKIFSDSYEISRTKFMLKLFRHRVHFVNLVLSNLYLAEDESQKHAVVSNYEYTHPDTKLNLTSNRIYLLEENIWDKQIFRSRRTWDKNNGTNSLLIKLITWNSKYVLGMLRESTLLNQNGEVRKRLELIPSFNAALQECERINVRFHVNASLSLDERVNTGTKSYDLLTDVKIWHQRFVLQNETWCILDSTCSPYLDFVGGHWQFLEQTHSHLDHVFMKRPSTDQTVSLKKAIFLIGRADENWYHLILDTLPRYLYLKALDDSIPVLIRSDLPLSSINFLKRILKRDLIFINSGDIVKVEELFFVASRSTAYDSRPIDSQEAVKFSPIAQKAFRKWILSASVPPLKKTFPEKLFISRNSKYRNLLNAKKVEDEFRKSGFDIINPSNDFYDLQEHYYAKASHLVAPGGAGLTNMVFMQSHSTVTSLVSWRGRGTRLWKKLAEACEIDLIELIGAPTNYSFKYMTRLHSNFILPLIIVRRYLKK